MRTDSTLCRAVTANRSIEASKLFNIRQRKYRTEKEKKKKKHTQHLNDSLNIAHVCCSCSLPPPHHCYFIDSNSKITHASSIAPTKLSIVSQNRRNTTTTKLDGQKTTTFNTLSHHKQFNCSLTFTLLSESYGNQNDSKTLGKSRCSHMELAPQCVSKQANAHFDMPTNTKHFNDDDDFFFISLSHSVDRRPSDVHTRQLK